MFYPVNYARSNTAHGQTGKMMPWLLTAVAIGLIAWILLSAEKDFKSRDPLKQDRKKRKQ